MAGRDLSIGAVMGLGTGRSRLHIFLSKGSHPLSSNRFCGDQYSFSSPCASNQTRPSARRSSTTVCALAFSQFRFKRSIETLTKPRTWIASRTVAWSVLSSLGTDRMYCLLPTEMMEKPEPRGSRDFTARRISSLFK